MSNNEALFARYPAFAEAMARGEASFRKTQWLYDAGTPEDVFAYEVARHAAIRIDILKARALCPQFGFWNFQIMTLPRKEAA